MSYLEVCRVLTGVGGEVPKFCGIGARVGVLKRGAGAESESEKGDSAHLCWVCQCDVCRVCKNDSDSSFESMIATRDASFGKK